MSPAVLGAQQPSSSRRRRRWWHGEETIFREGVRASMSLPSCAQREGGCGRGCVKPPATGHWECVNAVIVDQAWHGTVAYGRRCMCRRGMSSRCHGSSHLVSSRQSNAMQAQHLRMGVVGGVWMCGFRRDPACRRDSRGQSRCRHLYWDIPARGEPSTRSRKSGSCAGGDPVATAPRSVVVDWLATSVLSPRGPSFNMPVRH